MNAQHSVPNNDAANCLGVVVPDSPFLNDQRIARINAARYEGQEIRGALSVVRPGDRILEMGAGLGLVGAVALLRGQAAKLLSFEANPQLIPHIQALYDRNGLSARCDLRHQVLTTGPKAPATVPFFLRNSYLASSLIDSKRPTRQVDVPTADLETITRAYQPDVLLMDIEGGELALIDTVAQAGIRAIVIEFHPEVYGDAGMRRCKASLTQAGYKKLPDHCNRRVWTLVHKDAATK